MSRPASGARSAPPLLLVLPAAAFAAVAGWMTPSGTPALARPEPAAAAKSDPAASAAPARLPVPAESALKSAQGLVRDVFKAELASKKAADQKALAGKLLDQARDTKDEPAARYTLLREAVEAGIRAGDAEAVLDAVDLICGLFAVDEHAERAAVFNRLAVSVPPVTDPKSVAEAASDAADAALRADRFAEADTLFAAGEKAAIKAKEVGLAAGLRSRRARITAMKARSVEALSARKVLESRPDDPAANLAWGRYACLWRGDWEAGVACLARGSDAKLAASAKAELSAADAPAKAKAAADWLELADTHRDADEKRAIRRHAADLYRAAAPDLTGLAKAAAEKRLAELDAEAESGGAGPRTVNLIALIDPKADRIHGEWKVEKGVLHCTSGGLVPRLQIPYRPPAEYDFRIVFSQPQLRNPVGVIGVKGDRQFFAGAGGRDGLLQLSVDDKGGRDRPFEKRVKNLVAADRRVTLVVQVRKDTVRVTFDGRQVFQHRTDGKDLTMDGWHKLKDATLPGVYCDDPTVFHTVELVEIGGIGRRVPRATEK